MAAAQIWTLIAIWAGGLVATFTHRRRLNHRMGVGFDDLREDIRELRVEVAEFRNEVAAARKEIAGVGRDLP